jgi:integrase/recombinase XerC
MRTQPSPRPTRSAAHPRGTRSVDPQPLAVPMQDYLQRLAVERRYSPNTINAYRRDLTEFSVRSRGGWANWATHEVRRALAALHAQGLKPRSIARTLSAWRCFYADCQKLGLRLDNPCTDLHAPKTEQRLPNTLTPEAAIALVTSTPSETTNAQGRQKRGSQWQVARDAAVFELAYGCGLRVSELTGLNLDDVNFAAQELRVLGKGRKTRVVPMGAAACQALQRWLKVRPDPKAGAEQALFLGVSANRLSVRVVQQRIKQHAQAAGIEGRVHPHMLRHSFASHILQSSGDLRAVQELLGHASIASTQVYTHLDFQHLAKVYDAAHPRARRATRG